MPSLARPFVLLPAVAVLAACSDSTAPVDRLTPSEIVTECLVGTIPVITTTPQVRSGAIDGDDCNTTDLEPDASENVFGRIEVWTLPQASFGAHEAILIELAAEFDGVLVLFGEDGQILDVADDDLGGDLGSEEFLLIPNDTGDDYLIGVFSYQGEDDGEYSIAFTGTDAL